MPPLPSSRRRKNRHHDQRPVKRGSAVPLLVPLIIGASAVALIAYLLWPTWTPQKAGDPSELPVSVGGTIFNVPIYAMRRKVQQHSGPQDRIDLDFAYPGLGPAAKQPPVRAETALQQVAPVEVIFLSIEVADDTASPEDRVKQIYPRYLDEDDAHSADGLTLTSFRDDTPYANEDLAVGDNDALIARCTRDTGTPGMCMSERRIEGADLTFRFPRRWLGQWREVAETMDRLVARLHRQPH